MVGDSLRISSAADKRGMAQGKKHTSATGRRGRGGLCGREWCEVGDEVWQVWEGCAVKWFGLGFGPGSGSGSGLALGQGAS